MTVRDIAKEANVSIATVSRILNNDFSSVSVDTKERVQEIIKRNNYTLKAKKNKIKINRFAFVVPTASQMFFADFINACANYARENNMEMVLYSLDNNKEVAVDVLTKLSKSNIEYVLYMGLTSDDSNSIDTLLKSGKKVVSLDNIDYGKDSISSVFVDGEGAMYELTKKVIAKGHKNIAYITGTKEARFNNKRHVGHTRAMFENNITVNPMLTRFGYFTFESGYQCTNDLFDIGNEFSLILCENDLIAYGAMKSIREHGLRVPEDISVTGFDDMPISSLMSPPLTTVAQPFEQILAKAFDLFEEMNSKEINHSQSIEVPGTIIERDSVKDLSEKEEEK